MSGAITADAPIVERATNRAMSGTISAASVDGSRCRGTAQQFCAGTLIETQARNRARDKPHRRRIPAREFLLREPDDLARESRYRRQRARMNSIGSPRRATARAAAMLCSPLTIAFAGLRPPHCVCVSKEQDLGMNTVMPGLCRKKKILSTSSSHAC